MTGRFRRLFGAWMALGALAGALLLPLTLTEHVVWDEDVLGPRIASSRTQTQLTTGGSAGQGEEHCAVCHWLRSVSNASTNSSPLVAAGIAPVVQPDAGPEVWVEQLISTDRPSRAPPSVA